MRARSNPTPHALTAEQAARFEDAINQRPNATDRAVLRLLLHAGLRASEVCALDVHHIDLNVGEVHVPPGKTPARTVPITDENTLADLRETVEARGPSTDATRPLFVGPTGNRMRTARALWLARHVATSAGLDVRAATLRRTYAARLEREELAPAEIAARMGWSLVAT